MAGKSFEAKGKFLSCAHNPKVVGKRAKTIDNRFHEARNENNEPKEQV